MAWYQSIFINGLRSNGFCVVERVRPRRLEASIIVVLPSPWWLVSVCSRQRWCHRRLIMLLLGSLQISHQAWSFTSLEHLRNSQLLHWTCWCFGLPIDIGWSHCACRSYINIRFDRVLDTKSVAFGDLIISRLFMTSPMLMEEYLMLCVSEMINQFCCWCDGQWALRSSITLLEVASAASSTNLRYINQKIMAILLLWDVPIQICWHLYYVINSIGVILVVTISWCYSCRASGWSNSCFYHDLSPLTI